MNLAGVHTALITPFTDADEVDFDGLRTNIELQLEAGVTGVVPLGTTGETPTLRRQEQDEVLRATIDAVAGRARVIAGTGTNCTRTTVENTQRAERLGADAALVVTPYYNRPTQDGVVAHFEAIAAATGLPLLIYNIPYRAGVNIETETLHRLASIPTVVGVKEASGDIAQVADVVQQLQSADFTVLSGDDAMTLPLVTLGGKGVVSVAANLIPEQMVALTRAALADDAAAARGLYHELLPLFRALFCDTNPVPLKAAMTLRGMAAGHCRAPLGRLNEAGRERLVATLDSLELLRAGVGAS